MNLPKIIRLVWTFYKTFILASFIITACCIVLFWKYGISSFAILFWFKVTTLGVIYYFINTYRNREYYYFKNLGISKIFLWIVILTFDLMMFVLLISQTYKLR